jgi:hypothetical protein
MMNPLQLMVLFCIAVFALRALTEMLPKGVVWMPAYDGVWYADWYYWQYWLPGEIERTKNGQSAIFDLSDLPELEKRLEDHLTGRDLA